MHIYLLVPVFSRLHDLSGYVLVPLEWISDSRWIASSVHRPIYRTLSACVCFGLRILPVIG